MTLTLNEIADKIEEACKGKVIYDKTTLPIKLTADCYLFYGTELSEACHTRGHCKEVRYYALTGGQYVTILKEVQEVS
tara:strand:- start:2580 stop:2813 length:234 start_codon:yes stop_codon:yes gene_type:complete